MYAFNLQRATTAAEAARLAATGARPLAGGQTLVTAMKLRIAQVDSVVDLGGVAELAGIGRHGNALRVGAMTRHATVAASAEVQQAIPALADLAGHIGDRQVRTMGTLGGSLANNDPAACYPAAVLGLGATVHTTSRAIAADDFFVAVFTTALGDGELITAVDFPLPRRAAYVKFRQPASRFALIGVFVAQFETGVRVAVTGGGSGVFRHAGLERALNASFTPNAAASVPIDPTGLASDLHGSAEYRASLIGVMAQRAVARAMGA